MPGREPGDNCRGRCLEWCKPAGLGLAEVLPVWQKCGRTEVALGLVLGLPRQCPNEETDEGYMSDVAERVKKIVIDHLSVEADKVTESASFIDDLGADSLDTVELVMAFEEEFGCEIPDDAAEKIQTVGDAVKFLTAHTKAA